MSAGCIACMCSTPSLLLAAVHARATDVAHVSVCTHVKQLGSEHLAHTTSGTCNQHRAARLLRKGRFHTVTVPRSTLRNSVDAHDGILVCKRCAVRLLKLQHSVTRMVQPGPAPTTIDAFTARLRRAGRLLTAAMLLLAALGCAPMLDAVLNIAIGSSSSKAQAKCFLANSRSSCSII